MGQIIGGIVGGLGSFLGNSAAADAQKEAADKQYQATMQALALQRQIYDKNTANEQPYMDAGTSALTQYKNAIGLNGKTAQTNFFNNFQTDPYYKGVLDAGVDAVGNSWLGKGAGYGGNAMKAVNDYGAGLMQSAFNTRLSNLSGVAGQGLSATNALAGVGTNYANNSSNLMTNPQTNGTNNMANAGYYQGQGIIGVGNSMINAMNNYNQQNNFDKMFGAGYGSSNSGNGWGNSWNAFTMSPSS